MACLQASGLSAQWERLASMTETPSRLHSWFVHGLHHVCQLQVHQAVNMTVEQLRLPIGLGV